MKRMGSKTHGSKRLGSRLELQDFRYFQHTLFSSAHHLISPCVLLFVRSAVQQSHHLSFFWDDFARQTFASAFFITGYVHQTLKADMQNDYVVIGSIENALNELRR